MAVFGQKKEPNLPKKYFLAGLSASDCSGNHLLYPHAECGEGKYWSGKRGGFAMRPNKRELFQ